MSSPSPITTFACAGPENYGWHSYCSEEFTNLVKEADAAANVEEYEQLMGDANEVLKEEAVIVPLLAKDGVGLLHPDLQGWEEPKIFVDIQFKNLHW